MTTPPLQPITEDLTTDAVVGGYRLSGMPQRREGGSLLYAATSPTGDSAGLQIAADPVSGRRTRARFRRLAKLRTDVDHPALLPVTSVGDEHGRPYVVTAPVPTRSLANVLRDRPMEAAPAVRLLAAAAAGLDAAHARGLVHLTLGPESVLLDGRTVRLDLFGLFAVTGQASWGDVVRRDPHLRYEPPEAVRGEELDAAGNVYALAAMLVHALTGKDPYPEADPMLIEYAHVSQPPPKPSERDPRLPPEFDDLVARGMAKDPGERPRSAGRLMAEAAAILGVQPETTSSARSVATAAPRAPIPVAPVAIPEPPPAAPAPVAPAPATPTEPAPSRSRAVLDAWFADAGSDIAATGTPAAPAAPVPAPPAHIPPPASREEPTLYRPPLRVRLRPLLPLLVAVVIGGAFGLLIGMPESSPSSAPGRTPADLREIQRLDTVRERLRSDLAVALSPAEQGRIAERLATAHGVAAARLRSSELRADTQRLSDAYAAMAVAAKSGDADDFSSASADVAAAEDDLSGATVQP